MKDLIKNTRLIAASFLMLSLSSFANAGLLLNGDFEDGLTSWDTFQNVFVESSPTTLVNGSSALKLFGSLPASEFSVASQFVAVDGSDFGIGDVISLSGLLGYLSDDALEGMNRAYIEIAFAYNDTDFNAIDFGTATRSASINSSFAADTFFKVTTPNVTIPDLVFGQSTQFIRVAVAFVQGASTDAGAAWADDLQLSVVPAPASILVILLAFAGIFVSRRK